MIERSHSWAMRETFGLFRAILGFFSAKELMLLSMMLVKQIWSSDIVYAFIDFPYFGGRYIETLFCFHFRFRS